jgi:hypothetical protein
MSSVATVVSFQPSTFIPLALGFFGLGTGYLIYGPQELAGYPRRAASRCSADAERARVRDGAGGGAREREHGFDWAVFTWRGNVPWTAGFGAWWSRGARAMGIGRAWGHADELCDACRSQLLTF